MRGLTSVPQPYTPDINLNDVIDAIRQTDPGTYQSFQAPSEAGGAGIMTTSYPPVTTPNAKAMDLSRAKKHAYVKITEQPASKGLRFRYECEGRSAGCIPGVSSTNDKKTFPTIQVVGYKGRAVVVVSAVTTDPPHRSHPHNLVGKEGCSKGVCTIEMDTESMSCSFPSLGIQCVKKKEIEESLNLRQQIRVDPFQTGFAHRENPQNIDLNCLRLCFQVFLEGAEKGAFTYALKPVVSDPIFDKKAKNELIICRMTECSASVAGGKEILLFCEKVTKDDIEVRFYQEMDGRIVWEGIGEFQPSDVHKQYGICFRTPRYVNLEIEENVPVRIQLRRPSDGAVSDSRPFTFTPIDGGRSFWAAKRMKTNYTLFHSILSTDQMSRSNEDLRRKVPAAASAAASNTMMSPDSSNIHHVLVPSANVNGQITQPIQLVHATTFPPPPSPVKGVATVTCPTPELPPPPTPLIPALEEADVKVPPKAATMNLRSISNANLAAVSNTPSPSPSKDKPQVQPQVEPAALAVDLYEDIGQDLYDDVDTKYDTMTFDARTDPPVPPTRKKAPPSVVNTVPPTPIEEPNRPLPETPSKKASLISKLKPKGKKTKEEPVIATSPTTSAAPSAPGENGNRPSASLFQRLFNRSKSVDQRPDSTGSPPPVPMHRDDNGNDPNNIDDTQIQDFIDGGNLEELDNMVTEFAKEYMNDSSMDTDNLPGENNGNSAVAKS